MVYDEFRVGSIIQQMRLNMHLTQNDMAARLDVSLTHYAQIEQGSHKMSLDLMFKMMTVFNVDANTLLFGKIEEHDMRLGNVISRIESLDSDEKDGIIRGLEIMLDSICRAKERMDG